MDYAAAPIQPIVEGIVTFPGGVGTQPVFDGKGVRAIVRGGPPQGQYLMLFDVGLPGNAGAIEPFPPPSFLPDVTPDPNVRTLITPLGAGSPPLSNISTIGVSYAANIGTIGSIGVFVVMQNFGALLADPVNGFIIIVWRGL
jgi:hypothetical protein